MIYEKETYKIIGACMEVHKILGNGFLESVYQAALAREFELRGIPFEAEKEIPVYYKGEKLKKTFRADFICYEKIILETKAIKELTDGDLSQVINYLEATKHRVGLLVNFGAPSLDHRRVIK